MTDTMTVSPRIEASWLSVLKEEFQSSYFYDLKKFLLEEHQAGKRIYPPGKEIFNAFELTPFHAVKVVILGQDPYHGPNQAHGLSFSVKSPVKPPPSLLNIYKELADDIGFEIPAHGDLTEWAKQGVLLLNTALTVRANCAHSHRDKGWEQFTDTVIKELSSKREHIVFVLWGAPAKTKRLLIDERRHLVLTSAHPSPLSAYKGFFGCRHFSKINDYLEQKGLESVHWQL